MWYASGVPAILPEDDIQEALDAARYAQSVRQFHRRRTERGSTQREADIQLALDRLKDAMVPLRSAIGAFPYGPQTDTAAANRSKILETSALLQSERRKLWKMKGRK